MVLNFFRSARSLSRRGAACVFAGMIAAVLGVQSAHAQTATWTNGSGNFNWLTTSPISNWSGGSGIGGSPTSADIATFVGSTVLVAQSTNLNGTQSVMGVATAVDNKFLSSLLGGGTNQTLNIGTGGINQL